MEILMNWNYLGTEINELVQVPENMIGFIYLIEFTNGMKYIGKKHLYQTRTLKQLINKKRDNVIEVKYRNTGKGYRQAYEVVKVESNWRTYTGSAKECKNLTPRKKSILQFCKNEYELTYYEVYYQFAYDVLTDAYFINDNILGKFYRNKLKE